MTRVHGTGSQVHGCTSTLVLAAFLYGGSAFAQSQIVNARVETRQLTQSLDREIDAIAARGAAVWIAYRTPTVRGPQHWCSSNGRNSTRVMLEPATEIIVLVRVEANRIIKLQSVTPDCEVDAGGLPVVWLDGVTSAASAAWLAAQINAPEANGQRESKVVQPAIGALVWHPEAAALNTVIAAARNDRRSYIRSQALFWLSQRAGQEAVATIRNAVDADPETEVKRKAVFALSQLPKDDGVPLLIQVARNNPNREVRKQAMFWLGQSKDPRAVSFFEELLK